MKEFICKTFQELITEELYRILRHRSAIFVVEQHSVYQDVDDCDQDGIHLWLNVDGRMVAYARVLKAGVYLDEIVIGRVIAVDRGMGYGRDIFGKAMEVAQERLRATCIKIRAQVQAEKFYEKFGFQRCGEPFMYEELMHVDMIWRIENRVNRG